MTTYTLSWHHKVDGEWKRSSTTFDADVLPTFEESCSRISLLSNIAEAHNLQLEYGYPAIPYVQRKHKVKNTNSWKPKRYGK